jgi:dihydroorotate dehydrogenase
MEPEKAHAATVKLMQAAGSLRPAGSLLRSAYRPAQPGVPVHAFGLTFPNPVGLAAGYDKDGLAWRGLAALGFGHIEIGTVTLRPQPGNPQPRVFRLPEDEGIINRMGFPSRGPEFVIKRLQGPKPEGLVLGVNIGKNKETPLEAAAEDYIALMRAFSPLADYLAINVSSPNTPGLRQLQAGSALEALLRTLATERAALSAQRGKWLPLLVKLAPDLDEEQLESAIEAIRTTGIDGVIATNTMVARPQLRSANAGETGGLSGQPLRERSTRLVRDITRLTHGRLPIVAAGGIMAAEDAQEKLDAGAHLVQIYTGMIYRGPGFVRDIVEHLAAQPQTAGQLAPQGLAARPEVA